MKVGRSVIARISATTISTLSVPIPVETTGHAFAAIRAGDRGELPVCAARARWSRDAWRSGRSGLGHRGGGCTRPVRPGRVRCGIAVLRSGVRRGDPRSARPSSLTLKLLRWRETRARIVPRSRERQARAERGPRSGDRPRTGHGGQTGGDPGRQGASRASPAGERDGHRQAHESASQPAPATVRSGRPPRPADRATVPDEGSATLGIVLAELAAPDASGSTEAPSPPTRRTSAPASTTSRGPASSSTTRPTTSIASVGSINPR